METADFARQLDKHLFIAENELQNAHALMVKEGFYPAEEADIREALQITYFVRMSLAARFAAVSAPPKPPADFIRNIVQLPDRDGTEKTNKDKENKGE